MSGKMRYRCPYCGRAFKHAGSLQKHKHPGSLSGLRPGWCSATQRPSS